MLQKMRSFSKSIFASIFMGALALSFVVWGIADVFRTRSDTDVATVGSSVVSYDQFSRDYRNFIQNRSAEEKQQITPDMARKMGLGNIALDQVITRAALDNAVNKMGLKISDADIRSRIQGISAFYGPLGTFDKATFDRALAQRNFTEESFEDGLRGDMAREQLLEPVENGFQIPRGYAHALFSFATELRTTEYVVLAAQTVGPIPPPSDTVLASFVKSQPARFSTPDYRNVTVAVAGPEDVSASIKITDDQIKAAYEAKKAVYVVPEKRTVEQVSFSDEASAKAARSKIDGGLKFEDMAKAVGKPVDSRGDVSQDDLAANGAAVFALPLEGVSQPLKNFSTWILMHVSKITPGKTTTLDEAKPDIVKELTDQLAQNKLIDVSNAYTDATSSGAEFAQAAKKAGMRIVHVPAIDAQGLASDGSKVALPADPELVAQIFAAEVGESGDPFQTKTGHTYVISVEGDTPPKPKSLDAVRVEATRLWTAEQTAKMLQQRAAEFAAEASKSGDLKGVAAKAGSPVLTGPAITRRQSDNIFSPDLVRNIFAAKSGGIASGPNSSRNAYIIAHVTGIVHPPLPETSPQFVQGMRQVAGQIAGDITLSFAKAERDKQGVTINHALADRIMGGDSGS
ncbi:MAG: SurA N-terminal domain-containing protein [Rhizomicrobium sp.]